MSLLLAAFLAAVPAKAAAPSGAKAKPAKAAPQLPGDEVELKTADGWTLKARYTAPTEDKPVVLLLHGRGMTRGFWMRLAKALKTAGYGYFAPDLRGHGESQAAPDGQTLSWRKFKTTAAENDFANMSRDVDAAVAWLSERQVSEESIAVVGQDLGGTIALRYAAVHPKVPLLVMLAPGLQYQNVTAVNAMRAYKGRPVLMVYGEEDKRAASSAPILFQFAKQSAGTDKAALVGVAGAQGHKLLTSAVITQIIDWLGNPVPPAQPDPLPAEEADGEPAPGDAQGT